MCQLVELQKIHPDTDPCDERTQYPGDELAGRPHLLDLGLCSILDHPEILPYAAIALRRLRYDMCPELVEGHRTAGFEGRSPELVEGRRPELVEGRRRELVEGLSPQAMPADRITQ